MSVTRDPDGRRTYCGCPADHLSLILKYAEEGPDGCWRCTRIDTSGYGRIWHRGADWAAHRLAYIAFVGPVPTGFQIDHLCHRRYCINPDHLEPVTNQENALRGQGMISRYAPEFTCDHPRLPLRDESGTYCPTCYREWVALPWAERYPGADSKMYPSQLKRREAATRLPKTKVPPPIVHGKASTYSVRKCRCDECRAAWAAAHKNYMARRRNGFRSEGGVS